MGTIRLDLLNRTIRRTKKVTASALHGHLHPEETPHQGGNMGRTSGQLSAVAAMAILLAGAGAGATTVQQADVVYVGANVVTMDADQPTAKAVAVKGDDILAVGTNAEIQRHVGPNTRTIRLDGATVLPGFIDPHSHFLGYAFFTDAKNWLDVSSVNLFFKPLPDDPRCKDPTDPQVCFIPVRSQDDVIERIT